MCNFKCIIIIIVFFFKQKTAYEMRISDWSSDVCSSDLIILELGSDNPIASPTHAIVSAVYWPPHAPAPGQATFSSAISSWRGQIGRASCRERVCQYV